MTTTTLCEFCHTRPVQEPQTAGLWAGHAYCDTCLARPTWLPQPAYLVCQATPTGVVVYGPDHPVNREAS